jgi:uncharacterized membrane protein YjfL (UPF0719 family)
MNTLPATPTADAGFWDQHLHAIVSTLTIGSTAVALLFLTLWLLQSLKGYQVRKELVEDQNVALGIVIGAVVLGVSIVIASVASA